MTRPMRPSPRTFLGGHISADLSEQVRAGYIQGALTVLSADFSRKDLERWIAIDFKGGVITQRDAGRRRVRRGHARIAAGRQGSGTLSARVRRTLTRAAIEARDVRFKVPGGPDVLAGIDLTINDGEFVVIVGPSGCGKTTFLNMVAGLQGFTSGHLRVAGEPPQAGRRETAYALARDALLPWRDALGNVELALQIRGVAPEERRRRAREALARVGLADAATRHPAQLSQGHAPARRARAHLRHRAAPADPRRAVRRARRADPHPHAGTAARAAAAVLRHDDHGDARHRRGDHPRRPRRGVQPAPRDRHRDLRREARQPAAQDQRAAHRSGIQPAVRAIWQDIEQEFVA